MKPIHRSNGSKLQQAAIAISKKEKMAEGGMKDYLHDEAEKMSRKEFIEKHGESLAGFWDSINGTEEADRRQNTSRLKSISR